MRTVLLVGTDHKFQRPVNRSKAAGVERFQATLRELCLRYKVQAIAEEMNLQALQDHEVAESIPYQLCGELKLLHQYSDPSREERKVLGIRSDHDIELQGWRESWSRKKINASIRRYGSIASDRIREKEWLRRIQKLKAWPLLFVCGADHFAQFSRLLRMAGLTEVEAFKDWEPGMETLAEPASLTHPLTKPEQI